MEENLKIEISETNGGKWLTLTLLSFSKKYKIKFFI